MRSLMLLKWPSWWSYFGLPSGSHCRGSTAAECCTWLKFLRISFVFFGYALVNSYMAMAPLKITIFSRNIIYKRSMFTSYVSLPEAASHEISQLCPAFVGPSCLSACYRHFLGLPVIESSSQCSEKTCGTLLPIDELNINRIVLLKSFFSKE